MKIAVELQNNKQLDKFIELVNEFEKANTHLTFKKLKINFKYNLRASGEYNDGKPNTIDINPNRCDASGDFSFFLICVHEFSHLLDKKFKILKAFKEEFKEQRLFLTTYAKRVHDPVEEIAEIISLYLRNPYLLKLISAKHYEFVSEFFKSPSPMTREFFCSQYEKYSMRYKLSMEKKYGIEVVGDKIYKNRLLLID